ncbi:MAG: LysE family translocator [Proteobacteria bacterium]|nr:LysE family translocator [Pseudomonadota bacterium]
MTITAITAMFAAMVSLAVIPDASAIAVATRSITSGIKHGVIVIAGIIVGDLIFILIAVYGLSAISVVTNEMFIFIKYFGALYLVCFGFILLKTESKDVEIDRIEESTWHASFFCGLLITLGDPKAILFYISFLPAFLDLSIIKFTDVVIILSTAVIALCCSKLIYAFMADKSRILFKNTKAKRAVNSVAAGVMLMTAIFLIIDV